MNICKFYTNCTKVFKHSDRNRVLLKITFTGVDFEIETSKVLAMIYSAKEDYFTLVSNYKCTEDFIYTICIKTPFAWTKILIYASVQPHKMP